MRLPDPTTTGENEFKKSGRTRTRILEAAVDCLVRDGYGGTSTNSIAKQAGMMRSAMHYHFPSRMELIEAVIHYVTRERIRMYVDAISPLTEDDRAQGKQIDIYWAQLNTRLFRAFVELSTAARTDADLAAVLGPAMAEFDRARREAAIATRPKDASKKPYFDLKRDISRYLLEGIAQLDQPSYNAAGRVANIIGFLKALQSAPEELFLEALKRAPKLYEDAPPPTHPSPTNDG